METLKRFREVKRQSWKEAGIQTQGDFISLQSLHSKTTTGHHLPVSFVKKMTLERKLIKPVLTKGLQTELLQAIWCIYLY